jgi:hypothetical protein
VAQSIAIILRFRESEVVQFERLFEAEVYPLWQEFKAAGRLIAAGLTPVEDGSEMKDGVRDYILHLEMPGMADHHAFDTDPRFKSFLEKAMPMQPEEPKVWFGTPRFEI